MEERAMHAMSKRLRELRPNARFSGFTVQKMVRKPGAHELIVGAATDLVFGPVVLFGQGGTAVEVIGDRAVALPPLNMALAKELVSRTRVSKLLAGYRDRPAADREAVYLTLMQVAQLVADVPGIAELDINPLLADEKGVIALDARIRVAQAKSAGPARLAIRPYPKELEEWIALDGRQVLVRPIRPEDEPLFKDFLARISPEDIHFRFFHMVRDLPHTELARFTQIDYEREMSFIATAADGAGRGESLGEVRAVADPDNIRAEFAIMVRSDMQRHGLGNALLEKMIRYCRSRGTGELIGEVLSGNERMLALAEDLGFEIYHRPDPQTLRVRLKLQPD
ncbi:MAG: GNAT family N-acetyltransferase [Gammaproteobacteria bacterium]